MNGNCQKTTEYQCLSWVHFACWRSGWEFRVKNSYDLLTSTKKQRNLCQKLMQFENCVNHSHTLTSRNFGYQHHYSESDQKKKLVHVFIVQHLLYLWFLDKQSQQSRKYHKSYEEKIPNKINRLGIHYFAPGHVIFTIAPVEVGPSSCKSLLNTF